jgi:beta-phosphoglucomutase-like phosphatase (HAD superfamily)
MGSWVRTVREGRRALVTVDFSVLARAVEEDMAEDYGLTHRRRSRKAAQHMQEAEAVSEMGTQEGRTVREMWKNRREEAQRIRELLQGVPENLRHRANRLLRILDTTSDREDRNWVTRWTGESWIRREIHNR